MNRSLTAATSVFVTLSATSMTCAADSAQWTATNGGNGHWYVLDEELLTWQQAHAAATSRGGHLATPTSQAESDFLLSLVGPPLEPWIGGYQDLDAPDYVESAGGWRWVTGEPWEFTLWGINEPDGGTAENHLTFGGPYQGQWNDLAGGTLRTSLVEWSADCNGDGVVDLGQIRSGELADANGNNIPDCCESGACSPCQGDVTGNGTVDGVDLAAMLGAWGTNGQGEFETDVNEDGFVDGADLAILLGGWGDC